MTLSSPNKTISRRNFLITTGWLAAGTTMLSSCSGLLPALPTTADPELDDSLAWIQILPDGRIRFYCPRMEMGQGAALGLTQVVAEELNVGASDIDCILPDTNELPAFKMTVGSESIANFFTPVSYGAARLRETLRAAAAKKFGISLSQVKDGNNGFILADGTPVGYGALVPADPEILLAQVSSPSSTEPPQYAHSRKGQFKAIGQAWDHPETLNIVTGQTIYSRDVKVPNMVFGQVLRAPAFGARLQHADGRMAQTVPGVIAVIIDTESGFVGLVADNPFILTAALEKIDVQWDLPSGLNQDGIDAGLDVETLRLKDGFEHTLDESGSLSGGRKSAKFTVTARYDTSFAAHAAMEPRAGVAWVQKNQVDIWCGSQAPYFVQRRIAKALGRSESEVVVHTHRVGGGFGGRLPCQASEEAALLSAAVNRPVRVQWPREAEFQNNYLQPGFSHFINAGIRADGTLSHWDHDFVSSPIITGLVPKNIAWIVDKLVADDGTARGGLSQYNVINRRTRYADIRTPVPIAAWRGLGAGPNAFAIESMTDELAHAAKVDPLEFRLKNLPPESSRLANVLRRVGKISNWGAASPDGTGRGITCAVYKGLTPVAIVADVHVDQASGDIRVTNIWCVQDCGLVVNPDQVENQVMGNIIWGCSMALKERLTINEGAVVENNFDLYEILRHNEVPKMVIELVDAPDAPPGPAGESALGPVAPAIANAVFAATGQRVRRLPIRYNNTHTGTLNQGGG